VTTETGHVPAESFGANLRRMAPVWAIVLATAVAAMFMIRESGRRLLERGYYSQADTCQVGEIKYLAAMKIFRAMSGEIDAQAKADPLAASTLGALRGDARIADARALLEESLVHCPIIKGAHEALAAVEWWDGNEALAHFHLGLEHRAVGETAMARTEFETASAMEPSNVDYLLALAEELMRENRAPDAVAILADAPEAARDSATGLRIRASEAAMRSAWTEALDLGKRSLDAEPGNGDTIDQVLRYGDIAGVKRETTLWVADNLRKAVAPQARSWHAVAGILLDLGENDAALDAIDHAIAIQPNGVNLLMDKALILFALGREAEAVRAIELAVEKDYRWYFKLLAEARFAPLRPATQEKFGAGAGTEEAPQ